MGTNVNCALLSLYGGSLLITLTVPLNESAGLPLLTKNEPRVHF